MLDLSRSVCNTIIVIKVLRQTLEIQFEIIIKYCFLNNKLICLNSLNACPFTKSLQFKYSTVCVIDFLWICFANSIINNNYFKITIVLQHFKQ